VLHLAVPKLSADLEPTSSHLLWILDIYGSLITMGTLGDRMGRRRLLLIGASAFGAASVLAAFSRSAEMLIAAREAFAQALQLTAATSALIVLEGEPALHLDVAVAGSTTAEKVMGSPPQRQDGRDSGKGES
jgi:MFS transporter, DHA2 family, multidrug resistance protein